MAHNEGQASALALKAGYVRSVAQLTLLQTEIVANSTCPLKGIISIVTEDGILELLIDGNAAADLLIDLKQFLALELG